MRRIWWLVIAVVLAMALVGCGGSDQGRSPGGDSGQVEDGKLTFEKVAPGQEPAAVAAELVAMQAQVGAKAIEVDGMTYAVITAGEKSSGGWDVVVEAVGEVDGRIEIVYRIKAPAPGTAQTAAITYPSAVVRFKNPANLPIDFKQAE